jgi:hypothetical protein
MEWDQFVVKPSVSAGARLSARYARGDDITAHVAAIHATGSSAMVQPYVDAVDSTGETGTYVFGGEPYPMPTAGGDRLEPEHQLFSGQDRDGVDSPNRTFFRREQRVLPRLAQLLPQPLTIHASIMPDLRRSVSAHPAHK